MNISFQNPQYLWILLALPFFVVLHLYTLKFKKQAAIKFSNFEVLTKIAKTDRSFFGIPYLGSFKNKNFSIVFLRLIAYSLFVFSFTGLTIWYTGNVSKFDFILAIDSSSSMLADDFSPTRLEAAKNAALTFVDTITKNSKIGVVSFAGTVFTDLEPTTDQDAVKQRIANMTIRQIGGTNIGDTIVQSVNLLDKDEDSAIVLITDGRSNIGTPVSKALDYADKNNVVIHTIGMATEQGASFLNLDIISTLDEKALSYISDVTGGKFYTARDDETLKKALVEIADVKKRKTSFDFSYVFFIIGLLILSMELVLVNTIYRTIP